MQKIRQFLLYVILTALALSPFYFSIIMPPRQVDLLKHEPFTFTIQGKTPTWVDYEQPENSQYHYWHYTVVFQPLAENEITFTLGENQLYVGIVELEKDGHHLYTSAHWNAPNMDLRSWYASKGYRVVKVQYFWVYQFKSPGDIYIELNSIENDQRSGIHYWTSYLSYTSSPILYEVIP